MLTVHTTGLKQNMTKLMSFLDTDRNIHRSQYPIAVVFLEVFFLSRILFSMQRKQASTDWTSGELG